MWRRKAAATGSRLRSYYGANLGGNASFQPAVVPPRWRRSEPDGTGRRYAQIRTALGEASPYIVCRYRRIGVSFALAFWSAAACRRFLASELARSRRCRKSGQPTSWLGRKRQQAAALQSYSMASTIAGMARRDSSSLAGFLPPASARSLRPPPLPST